MLKTSLQLSLSQQLTMTPQLQQAIKLLQLSTLELQTEIQSILESNPMLERIEDLSGEVLSDDSISVEKLTREFQDSIQNKHHTLKNSSHSSEFNNDYLDTIPMENKTLQEHLKTQLHNYSLNELDLLIAYFILDAIDDRGYLSQELSELSQAINQQQHKNINTENIAKVLSVIQQLDPIGVGARSLKECLLIQLDYEFSSHSHYTTTRKLIENYLPLISKNDFRALKRKLKLTNDELSACICLIQSLEPKPGRNLSGGNTQYIVPDLIVHKTRNGWTVSLNEASLPKIAINSQYSHLTKSTLSQEDSLYIRSQLQEAKWFLKSLNSRNETLMKVASQIMVRQKDFLDYGEEAMKPMVLQDIAQAIEMHESTVSRITTQKYIHTPRGIFELKYFFSSHLETDSGGACSSTAIRAIIKKIISSEKPNKPLSDSQIAKLLIEQGIKVARRTIAKYRESLKIPSSSMRKQKFIQSN